MPKMWYACTECEGEFTFEELETEKDTLLKIEYLEYVCPDCKNDTFSLYHEVIK